MSISGNAKIAGVMGWPIAHSLSPALHGFWIREHGLDAAYVPMAVTPDNFEEAVRALPRLGFRGANVTIPHKERAFQLSVDVDDAARATGAVNTLVVDGDRVIGRNTDVSGYLASLDDAGVGSLDGRVAVVLGAGGAARGIIFGLLSRGAGEVIVVNRTAGKADALVAFFGSRVKAEGWERLAVVLGRCDLLVNTTSLGMKGQEDLRVDLSKLKASAGVSDIVYRPLETTLLAQARERGHKTVEGLGMLLHQARPGFAAWFGVEPVVSPQLRQHLVAILEARS